MGAWSWATGGGRRQAWGVLPLLLALVLAAAAPASPAGARTVPELLEARLAPLPPPTTAADAELAALGAWYGARGWAPIWTGEPDLGRARALPAALRAAAEAEGLPPGAYGLDRVEALLARADPEALAELELELSRLFLRYARDVRHGRLEAGATWDVPTGAPPFVPEAALDRAAAASGDVPTLFASLAPDAPDYVRLRDLLAALRRQGAAGTWTAVPAGTKLEPGVRLPAVAALRRRLAEAGDLRDTAPAPADLYDGAVQAAVRAFQGRHGLEADGVAGPATLAALNVPAVARAKQVAVAMERRRHARPALEPRHVLVNIPDFRLRYVDGPAPDAAAAGDAAPRVYESRVVVGTKGDPTPAFSGLMTYLDLNPTWNVPRSIAVGEMLPKLRADPSWLGRNGYQLLASGGETVDPGTVDWSTVGKGNFPYRVRQRAGGGNALGRVKFMFPNAHSVYIHDTPSKKLFGRAARAFSHGCVRLANPFELAGLLLGPQGWDTARIEAAVGTGRTRTVTLKEPVPVHLTYETAWVTPEGEAHFREDLYGRDAERARALGRGASRPFVPAPLPPPAPPPVPEAPLVADGGGLPASAGGPPVARMLTGPAGAATEAGPPASAGMPPQAGMASVPVAPPPAAAGTAAAGGGTTTPPNG